MFIVSLVFLVFVVVIVRAWAIAEVCAVDQAHRDKGHTGGSLGTSGSGSTGGLGCNLNMQEHSVVANLKP